FQNFERLLLPLTDAVIFESRFARERFRDLIGRPRSPDPVIHNGLHVAEFEPVELLSDAADFVFIGEFRALKGIHVLLEALGPVRAPDGRPATLVMAGGGPEFEAFKGAVAAAGMSSRIVLVGVQPA